MNHHPLPLEQSSWALTVVTQKKLGYIVLVCHTKSRFFATAQGALLVGFFLQAVCCQ